MSKRAEEAIPLARELSHKGIQAGNVAPGRVNISTNWGGYRENSGRKPSGKRPATLYVTQEEEQKLRDYLASLRK